MQQVNTFDVTLEERAFCSFARQIHGAWDHLQKLLTNKAEAAADAPDGRLIDGGPAIFANYYDGAYDRVSAAEPVVTFRRLAR